MERYSGIMTAETKVAKAEPNPNDPKAALEAIGLLLKEAGLEKFDFYGGLYEYRLDVPTGFESLFKTLAIKIDWNKDSTLAWVDWDYDHPDGGHNGYQIGAIGFDDKTKKWFWRYNATGKVGYVE